MHPSATSTLWPSITVYSRVLWQHCTDPLLFTRGECLQIPVFNKPYNHPARTPVSLSNFPHASALSIARVN